MGTYLRLRDQVLEQDVREVLTNDERLKHLDVQVRVDGGVAHVDGRIGCDDEARLLRRAVGRVKGIHAVWDLVRRDSDAQLSVIDVGCGGTKQRPWAVGVDRVARHGVDVVGDLERGLPFASQSIDHVFAVHVLEHVTRVFTLLEEIHRVLKPTGVLHVMVPDWRHANAVADPTHVRFFGPQTFRHFCEPAGEIFFEPVTLTATDDTVFADLEPVLGKHSVPFDRVLARFFTG